jgi:hypothetical protein
MQNSLPRWLANPDDMSQRSNWLLLGRSEL